MCYWVPDTGNNPVQNVVVATLDATSSLYNSWTTATGDASTETNLGSY